MSSQQKKLGQVFLKDKDGVKKLFKRQKLNPKIKFWRLGQEKAS